MEDLARKTYRNFLDCQFFISMNKVFFIALIICQLIQSMTFNGALDIPTLFLILLMFSCFAFRMNFVRFYGLFTMFLVYFIHLMIFIKILFTILSRIDYVSLWIKDNATNKNVIILSIIFGLDVNDKYSNEITPMQFS